MEIVVLGNISFLMSLAVGKRKNILGKVSLASTPYSLEYLKKLGFRTFDQWWDESYDHEEDHEKRILKIFEVIDFIDSHDLSRLKKIYDEMHDVFEHNKEKLKSLKNDLMIFK